MFRTTIAALVAALVGCTAFTLLAGPAAADELCIGCPAPTTTTTTAPPQESGDPVQTLVGYLNQERQANGLPRFALRQDVSDIASGWSRHMADTQSMSHNASYFSEETRTRLHAWALGENVAASPSLREAHDALMASAPHRQNILDARFTVVGIGAVQRDGRWWITEDFLQPEAARAAAPVAAPAPTPPPPARPAPDVVRAVVGASPAKAVSGNDPAVRRPLVPRADQTMRLEPAGPAGAVEKSSPLAGGTGASVPVGLVGLAAVGIWGVGSALLTTAVRRRVGTRPRATRTRLSGFGSGLPAAG
jgi:uncharacterized protein YkwD